MKQPLLLSLAFALNIIISTAFGQDSRVVKHENVIYDMVSGMALLMDIYQPEKSNHLGIIFINGSGFGYLMVIRKFITRSP